MKNMEIVYFILNLREYLTVYVFMRIMNHFI